MIGLTSSPGLPSPANLLPRFFCPAPPFAFEASGRRKNNSICSIWCQSTRRSSLPTPTRRIHSKSIPVLSTDRNMVRHRDITITKWAILEVKLCSFELNLHTRCLVILSTSNRNIKDLNEKCKTSRLTVNLLQSRGLIPFFERLRRSILPRKAISLG